VELYLHPPMYLRGLMLRQEQGHLCAIYNHRFQVIEFGKSASRCEFLGFRSGRVEASALLGLSAYLLLALCCVLLCYLFHDFFWNIIFYLHPLIQEHDQGVEQGLGIVGNEGRRS